MRVFYLRKYGKSSRSNIPEIFTEPRKAPCKEEIVVSYVAKLHLVSGQFSETNTTIQLANISGDQEI